jgi:hypothetical protein
MQWGRMFSPLEAVDSKVAAARPFTSSVVPPAGLDINAELSYWGGLDVRPPFPGPAQSLPG